MPAAWFDKDAGKAPKVRVAVIGSGGAFCRPHAAAAEGEIVPRHRQLAVESRRSAARDAETWQYPRFELTPTEHKCWFVVCYGLPFAFVYLGTMVWLMPACGDRLRLLVPTLCVGTHCFAPLLRCGLDVLQ